MILGLPTYLNFTYTIRYGTIEVFNVESKAEYSALSSTRTYNSTDQCVLFVSKLHTCRLVADAGIRRLRSAVTRTLVVGCTQSSFGGSTSALEHVTSVIRPPLLFYDQFMRSLTTLFSFRALGPRRSATCVTCDLETFLLTYLPSCLESWIPMHTCCLIAWSPSTLIKVIFVSKPS